MPQFRKTIKLQVVCNDQVPLFPDHRDVIVWDGDSSFLGNKGKRDGPSQVWTLTS